MTVLPSGEQIAIAHGDQRAVITEVGATLRTYVKGGVSVIEGFAGDELPEGAHGQLMYPWPNRLSPEPWTFSGRTAVPSVDDHSTGTAIHGLVRWRPFEVDQVNQNRCVLSLRLHPSPEYPFLSEIAVAYHLGSLGLTVTTTVTNLDDVPIPAGVGFHPYLAVTTATIEGAELEVPASAYVATGERLLPTGEILPVAGRPIDFTVAKSVSGIELNVTYTELRRDNTGLATVKVRDRDGGVVELEVDRNFPYIQVYTGDELSHGHRRTSIGVEPMTCPPEALRSGKDLIVLEPGQHWAGSWRLRRHDFQA
ncbi:MAG: aldose epimerase [Acidobacteriota bacterium]|nr:aldose epimerase [Acidobacteriota bacterium]MDE3092882.1 aldose epimerase [Acidobacteriota bacterium]MDE3139210.1 aldose epimerase [Acidobacteriota bacterium]MDE3146561.1 aldose epimerase [Acidobacteriota bacterium]